MIPLQELQRLNRARRRLGAALTIVMIAVYATFILLIAYDAQRLTSTIVPGLSVGILLGSVVILLTWVLIGIYVRWTNLHYDGAIAEMRIRA